MTATDYILDLTLIGLVFLQIRGRRLSPRSLLIPIGIVAYVASTYLHGIPTSGNSLVLVAVCAAVGITLGAGAGMFTKVTHRDGNIYAQAGVTAAVLWVTGVGTRLAFQLWATHGGANTIATFSAHHHISLAAWTAALILMALGEAMTRTAIIAWRAYGHQLLDNVAPLATGRSAMMGSSEHAY